MKRLLVPAFQILGLSLLAFVLGEGLWWSLWMNHGWPTLPNILGGLLGADGEAAYDAQGDQMAIVIFIALLAAWFVGRQRRAAQSKKVTADV
jgi:hypothetical protein